MSYQHSPTEVPKLPPPPPPVNNEDESTVSVVHVTVTEAGTVVYTQTATSYSYIPSYTAVKPTATPTSHSGSDDIPPSDADNTNSSKNALIGGIVGGVGSFIILALIAFLLVRRSRLKKKKKNITSNEFTTSPIKRPQGQEIGPYYYDPNETIAGYYEDRLWSQHHGGYSKYASMNRLPASNRHSMITESSSISPPVTVVMGQVPNEIERNVPHLKESEPPHTK